MNKEQLLELGLSEEQADKVIESQQQANAITKEQFGKMTYNEHAQLYNDSPEIYQRIYNGSIK